MAIIVGKIKHIVYHNNSNGYIVAVFRVRKEEEKESYSINVVGIMPQLYDNITIELQGNVVYNEKYKRNQFEFVKCEKIIPTGKELIIEFLTSSLVSGCGKKTAENLYAAYKEETLEKIKDIENLKKIGLSDKISEKIHKSVEAYSKSASDIQSLQELGFSVEESSKILAKFPSRINEIIENNFYELKEVINFQKVDSIYVANHDYEDFTRLSACVYETMVLLSQSDGHTYYVFEQIKEQIKNIFNLYISYEDLEKILDDYEKENLIVKENEKIFLKDYYESDEIISNKLKKFSENLQTGIKNFDELITDFEKLRNIEYDDVQKKAIENALINNVTIISGGPGTGKTTILNSIVKMYINTKKLSNSEICAKIALLAPTGRASKKMSQSTGLSACTIHRFLKWNKEDDLFEFNEDNKVSQEFIIIDECSMIDTKLFSSLLRALKDNVKILLVGDTNQLPSVGAGLVFASLIESDFFNFTSLTRIYRQSDNSYIPDLASNIKQGELDESFLSKKDDYNFLMADTENIRNVLSQILFAAKSKLIDENDMQVLVPVYKGINGITQLNEVIRNVYNPKSFSKKEFIYNEVIYRENDKILHLVNDVEKNIFNGDIGFIKSINIENKKLTITIKFEDEIVTVEKPYFKNFTHAYAISVHKSQGSEFDHVVMPISREYYRTMYNKLIYTGVSRAKKTLTLIGDPVVFNQAVNNNNTDKRNTNLLNKLNSIFLDK